MKTGGAIGQCHRRHRSVEFRRFVERIEAAVPAGLDFHMILDKHGTHRMALIWRSMAKRPRFHMHFTPMGSSWLSLVERWFAPLTETQLRRGVHRSSRELEAVTYSYLEMSNEDLRPCKWKTSLPTSHALVSEP